MRTFIFIVLVTTFTLYSTLACGVSSDEHDAVVAAKEAALTSIVKLEREKQSAMTSLANLEREKRAALTTVNQLVKEIKATKASVTERELENAIVLDSVLRLEHENLRIQNDFNKSQSTLGQLKGVYPPRRFKDRFAIESWLRADEISKRNPTMLVENWLSKALEQQTRALRDGYIVSADYIGPDEDNAFQVWVSTVTDNLDYFLWDPESNEVLFITNINLLE